MAGKDAKAESKAEASEATGVKIRPDTEKYVKGVSGTGKKTLRTNDAIAQALDGLTLDEVYGVAVSILETPLKDLQNKYSHLNVGMQRMNLGNRIRGAVAKQDKRHEADKTVANGGKLLEIAVEKPRAAAKKRAADKAAADKKAADEAAKKAIEKEKAEKKAATA